MKAKKYNSINVSGNVKISTQRGKRKVKQQVVKNNATVQLFSFLTHALNDQRIENNIPSFLKIMTTSEADSVNWATTVSKQQTSISGNKITFGFFVSYGQLGEPGSTKEWEVTRLQLYGQDGQAKLAEVDLTTPFEGIFPNSVGYSLLIDWTIGFQNAVTNSTSTD